MVFYRRKLSLTLVSDSTEHDHQRAHFFFKNSKNKNFTLSGRKDSQFNCGFQRYASTTPSVLARPLVNIDVVQNDFREKRIPLMISRVHTSPYLPGMPSSADWDIRYIPEEKLLSFLAEAGMSPEEMEQCEEIRGDFAYSAFKKKQGINDENSPALLTQYHQLFRRHSRKLDAEAYFSDKFTQSLSRHFGEKRISRKKLVGFYRGERTEQQQREYPGCFVFEQNGRTFRPGLCLVTQSLDYKIYHRIANKSSLYARLFQPVCYERAILSLILARKML